MKVELSEEAHSQVSEIDSWWRENRLAAPDLFMSELVQTLTMLEGAPHGSRYETGTRQVRRVLLRRTHYHLYFIEDDEQVFVVAVWSAFRGRGPKL